MLEQTPGPPVRRPVPPADSLTVILVAGLGVGAASFTATVLLTLPMTLAGSCLPARRAVWVDAKSVIRMG